MLARVIAIATCLTVCTSVTRRYCVKTKKASVIISSPSGSPKTIVFRRQISSQNSKGFPRDGVSKKGWVGKFSDFLALSVNISKTVADTAKGLNFNPWAKFQTFRHLTPSGNSDAQPCASEFPEPRMSKITNDRLNPVWHRMFHSCTHRATMGIKVLNGGNVAVVVGRLRRRQRTRIVTVRRRHPWAVRRLGVVAVPTWAVVRRSSTAATVTRDCARPASSGCTTDITTPASTRSSENWDIDCRTMPANWSTSPWTVPSALKNCRYAISSVRISK